MRYVIALIITFLCVIPISLNAQICSSGSFVGHAQIPSYGVQQIKHNNIFDKNQIIVKQKVVEFDADYFLGLRGYYSVADQLRSNEALVRELKTQEIIERQQQQIDELLSIMKELIDKQNGNNQETPFIPTPDHNDITPDIPDESDFGEIPAGDDVLLASELDTKVFNVFNAHCASCHSGDHPKGNIKLIGKDVEGSYLVNLTAEQRENVYDVVSNSKDDLLSRGKKPMPLGGPSLNEHDIEILKQWMLTVEKG